MQHLCQNDLSANNLLQHWSTLKFGCRLEKWLTGRRKSFLCSKFFRYKIKWLGFTIFTEVLSFDRFCCHYGMCGGVCAILTVTNVLAEVPCKANAKFKNSWGISMVRIPYPVNIITYSTHNIWKYANLSFGYYVAVQCGWPTVSIGAVLAFCVA